ncbi:MAG: c-type cytochrome [Ottowia sp.]|nr:c-type cytochrome [Ottowia sp.]
MSDNTHEEMTGPIKTGKQFFWVAVASFVVPFFTIVALVSWINAGDRQSPGATDTTAKVEARIQPVARVAIEAEQESADEQPAAPAQQAAAEDAQAAGPADDGAQESAEAGTDASETEAQDGAAGGQVDLAAGQALYEKSCVACHGSGVAGAPKLGDSAAWTPRIDEGMTVMMDIAINGKGAMPPRGASSASDEELRNAVLYMVNEVDPDFVDKQAGK